MQARAVSGAVADRVSLRLMRPQIRVVVTLLAAILGLMGRALAGAPIVTDVDWETACEGSNIRVTRIDGRIAAIEAFAQHFAEARQWQCRSDDGQIVSALYRHSKVLHNLSGDEAQLTTELRDDRVTTYHFPHHHLTGMPPDLRADLQSVLRKAEKRAN